MPLGGMLLVEGGMFGAGEDDDGGPWLNPLLVVTGPGDWGGGVVLINLPALPFFLLAGGTYFPSLLPGRDY